MNPTYHPEAQGLAFNVKTHGMRFAEGGTGQQRQSAWEATEAFWWQDAGELARKYGFEDVYAAGRSGGWLAPTPAVNPADERTDPDGFAADLSRLRAFGDELQSLFNEVPERFAGELKSVIQYDADCDARHEAARLDAERQRTGYAKLLALAQAVAACDTTSDCLKRQAREALELLA